MAKGKARKSARWEASISRLPNVLVVGGLDEFWIEPYANVQQVSTWWEAGVFEAVPFATGIILTGGGDLNPERYGGDTSNPYLYGIDRGRDSLEVAVMRYAEARGIPILGICRGAQNLNVFRGGTLTEHIPHRRTSIDHHSEHDIHLADGETFGTRVLRQAVSLHHQAVDRLGGGLVPLGWAEDGTLEAFDSSDGLALGVQFHPELDIGYGDVGTAVFEYWARRLAVAEVPWKVEPRKSKDEDEDGWKVTWDSRTEGCYTSFETEDEDECAQWCSLGCGPGECFEVELRAGGRK